MKNPKLILDKEAVQPLRVSHINDEEVEFLVVDEFAGFSRTSSGYGFAKAIVIAAINGYLLRAMRRLEAA